MKSQTAEKRVNRVQAEDKLTPTQTAEKLVSRVLTEQVLTLTQARWELAEITGQRPDKATVYRWCLKGCHGTKLDHIRLGNQIFTSREALTRFIVARTAAE